MAETKKVAVAKPAAKAVAKAADVKKEETKAVVANEAPKAEVKKTAKKASAKKETKKETTKKASAKKAGAAEKTTASKKKIDAEVVIQVAGEDYTMERLVGIAKDVWQFDLNQEPSDFKTVRFYVKKDEERKVYYVINGDVSGSFGI